MDAKVSEDHSRRDRDVTEKLKKGKTVQIILPSAYGISLQFPFLNRDIAIR
jgi:hypothetical protein